MGEDDQKDKKARGAPNEKLRHERLRRQLTHAQLADMLGIGDPRTISRWERGVTIPSPLSRQRLCDVFGKSEEELGLLETHTGEQNTPPTEPVLQQQTPPASGSQLSAPTDIEMQQGSASISTPSVMDGVRHKNRQRLIAKVQAFWITGILEQSVRDNAHIALGLQVQTGAVDNPWQPVLQPPNQPVRPLLSSAPITHIYDNAAGELLILGEAGSGKTTLLLELARDLLKRAKQGDTQPIPVIFNLSSWAAKRPSIADWLVEELSSKYQVPRTLGQAWVDTNQVLLLLDGLDEVSETHRQACVQAIDAFHREHALVPLVVCSRFDEYLAQIAREALITAVVVQPLSTQQIETYLISAGPRLEGLRAAMADDPTLQELAITPLMLSILSLTYSGKSLDEIQAEGTTASRKRMFELYTMRMLQRQNPTGHYTPQETTHWLAWLARQMKRQNQAVFYIEQLQLHWLSGDRALRAYDWLGVRLPGMLIGALVGLAVIAFLSYADLSFSVVGIVLGGFLGELWSGRHVAQRFAVGDGRTRSVLWLRILLWLGTGALIGLILTFAVGVDLRSHIKSGTLSLPESQQQRVTLSGWLSAGLSFGLWNILLQLLCGESSTEENSHSTLKTMWQRLVCLIRSPGGGNGLLTGLLFVLISGAIGTLVYGLVAGPAVGLFAGVLLGLFAGVLLGLFVGLLVGPSSGFLSALLIEKGAMVQPVDQLHWSWGNLGMALFSKQHIRPSVVVGLTFGLAAVLIAVLIQVLIAKLTFRPIYLESGLFIGLINGLTTGLGYWLLLGFWQGVSSTTIEDQRRVVPNQGIRRSAYNGLALGLVSAMIVGLTALLRQWLASNLSVTLLARSFAGLLTSNLIAWPSAGLLAGLFAGLVAGLLNGGLACLRHYVLRFLLWRAGLMPWHYAQFLDYAAGRILLRKVGGGYIFIHRLLLEYFASL